jgi:peptidoglycan-associated lipoprotein
MNGINSKGKKTIHYSPVLVERGLTTVHCIKKEDIMKHVCVLMIIGMVLLVGCAPKTVEVIQKPTTSFTERNLSDQDGTARDRRGITEEELARAERERLLREQEGKAEALMKDINFEYDSYIIASSELPKINAVGSYLKQNGGIKIVSEGHCDERGTVEYNLALGQKRAEAVKAYLVKMGIDSGRIRTISFGAEVPVDPGHTEDAWTKNRRAHFKIDQKG